MKTATIQPMPSTGRDKRLGTLKGAMKFRGDLVRFDWSRDWEMLR